jgi:hypothetical protein
MDVVAQDLNWLLGCTRVLSKSSFFITAPHNSSAKKENREIEVRFSLEEDGYLYFIYNVVSIGVSELNSSVKQRAVVQAEGRADIIPYIIYAMPRRGQPKPCVESRSDARQVQRII